MRRETSFKNYLGGGMNWEIGIDSQSVSSVAQSRLTLCDPMNHSTPGLPVHHQLLEFTLMSIESVMPSNCLILCCPLLLLSSIFPRISVFSSELALRIRSFSFSISPSNEYSGLISFRMDWFDLLAVQGLSRVFSSTAVRKHHFFGTQPCLLFNSHIHT